jgi:hypothetical protein
MFSSVARSTLGRLARTQTKASLRSYGTPATKPLITKNGTLELLAGASLLGMGGLWVASTEAQAESPDHIHPMEMPWGHSGIFSSYDTASLRRGYIVYKNVCAACHSMERIHYRELVGVCMSEAEAKAAASEIDVVDGPNDIGAMFERPGKLSDPLPSPYANGELLSLSFFLSPSSFFFFPVKKVKIWLEGEMEKIVPFLFFSPACSSCLLLLLSFSRIAGAACVQLAFKRCRLLHSSFLSSLSFSLPLSPPLSF